MRWSGEDLGSLSECLQEMGSYGKGGRKDLDSGWGGPVVDDVGALGEGVGLEECHQILEGLLFGFLVLVIVHQSVSQRRLQRTAIRSSLYALDDGDPHQFLHGSCTHVNTIPYHTLRSTWPRLCLNSILRHLFQPSNQSRDDIMIHNFFPPPRQRLLRWGHLRQGGSKKIKFRTLDEFFVETTVVLRKLGSRLALPVLQVLADCGLCIEANGCKPDFHGLNLHASDACTDH